jgi:hypothetical protein
MRKRHETGLERLKTQKFNVKEMARAEDHIKLFCKRVWHNLDSFDFDDKRFALRALQIKAIVTKDTVRVKGIIGLSKDPTGAERGLATTARTSGCMFNSDQKHNSVPIKMRAQLPRSVKRRRV